MQKKNEINTNSSSVICSQTNIGISNDRMENILSRVYEQARKDACKFRISNYYNVAFSIFGTLVISLLTSDFHGVGPIEASRVVRIAYILCAVSLLLGIVLLIRNASEKNDNMTDERDLAIKNEINKILNKTDD